MKKNQKSIRSIICLILTIIINSKIITFNMRIDNNQTIEENTKKYSEEIDEYNQSIEDYANYINSLNLTDLQIIMKVINDQWEMYKYGQDEDLITGYYRLSFQENGYGVCTSFADDFTAKMNAINPAYEAKNVYCYVSDSIMKETIEIVDIERKKVSSPEPVRIENEEEQYPSYQEPNDKENQQEEATQEPNQSTNLITRILFSTKVYGNHTVSMIKIPGEEYNLIVDPTNLMIGVIKDGQIYMFNTNSEDTIEYVQKGNIVLGGKDYVSRKDTYYESDDTLEEITCIYSYEEQLEALRYIENLDKHNQCYTKRLKNNNQYYNYN